MLSVNVGLVDLTGTVDTHTMAAVAAALNIQVTRDLPRYWGVQATVSYLADPRQVPQGVWPVQLVKELPPGEGGFHMTSHNQPYAKVIVTPGSLEWSVDASHETIEMLVDPNGNRLQAAGAIGLAGGKIEDAAGKFEYLVEACDPCEADPYTYQIEGVSVSDFITPNFYDAQETAGTRYSFTGAITRPRQLLPGGYISWVDPQTSEMKQLLWVDPKKPPQLRNLGPAPGGSLRLFIESRTHELVRTTRGAPSAEREKARAAYREELARAGRTRATHYR